MPSKAGESDPAGTGTPTGTPPAPGAAGTATPAAGAASDAGDKGAQGQLTQAAVDAIVARERKRAETELANVRTDYETRISAIEARLPKPPGAEGDKKDDVNAAIEAARRPLQDELATERAQRLKLEETTLSSMIAVAAKDTLSPETVALLAKGQVRMKDGAPEVVDDKGQPRYTANGPMTVKDLVAEITAKNEFLLPATMRKGAQYKGADGQPQGDIDSQIKQLEKDGKHVEARQLKVKKLASMKA